MALTQASYSMITGAPTNILDWIPPQYHAAIANFTSTQPVQSYIQAAMDSGAASIYFPQGYYVIASALYVTQGNSGSNQASNLTFVGENRTSTYLAGPGASSFTPASFNDPTSGNPVRAMIINQSDNGKFSLKNMRFQGDIGAGNVFYCVENGSNSQAAFSGVIEDCWFSLSSTNAGIIYGALQNFVVANNTIEQAKCFHVMIGAGNGDIHYTNNSMFVCYDGFIDASRDITNVKNLINVDGLNCYSYLRGPLFSGYLAQQWNINNVNLFGSSDPSNPPISAVGFCTFQNCTDINISNFNCIGTSTYPLADVVVLDGASINLTNGFISYCTSGIKMTGNYAGGNVISVTNVNIAYPITSAFYHSANNPGGSIYINNCNWSNSQGDFWLDQAGSAIYSVTIRDSVFINAGYPSTSASTRCFDVGTTGDFYIYNSLIGRSTTTALANYYINANGTGAFTLTDCTFTALAAPAGVGNEIAGSQVVKIAGGLKNRYAQYYASAVPTSGTWNQGDIVFNSVPATGSPKGWVCTVAGTPGTWVSMGNL